MLVKLHHLPKFFEYDTYLWNHHLHHGCMYFLLENNKTNWRFPHHAAEGWWRMGRQNGCMMIHQAGTKTNTQTVMLVVPPKTSPQLFFVFFFLLTILTASRNSQCFFFDNIDINVYIKYNMYIIYCSMIIYNTVYKYIYISVNAMTKHLLLVISIISTSIELHQQHHVTNITSQRSCL